ncbi:MAG: methylated-DNA--[protein]-cysteine S-methyltransferase [Muribaculaceae bacterium]|nr:methylated-DNA--[protein]-cysteine S-methyltransferase [Muribaculaceae bacterium]
MIDIFTYSSPLGEIWLGATADGALCLCEFAPSRPAILRRFRSAPGSDGLMPKTVELAMHQLDEYFAGQRQEFDLPLTQPGTPFQQEVWRALRRIPYGTTISYAQLAATIGRPTAYRAVAAACRANAIGIIVPCHRVIGSSSALTGYAGGLDRKRRLLDLEVTYTATGGSARMPR